MNFNTWQSWVYRDLAFLSFLAKAGRGGVLLLPRAEARGKGNESVPAWGEAD
jgi:hypothetical protein